MSLQRGLLAVFICARVLALPTLHVCIALEKGFDEVPADVEAAIPDEGVIVEDVTTVTGFDVTLRQYVFNTRDVERDGVLNASAPYDVRLMPSFEAVIVAVRNGICDVGWSPFYDCCNRRECDPSFCGPDEPCCIGLSPSYFKSGVGILFKIPPLPNPTTSSIFSFSMVNSFSFITIMVVSSAHVIWVLEKYGVHHRNSNSSLISTTYVKGIKDALWWSAVTVTTVGYGDKTPRSGRGRCFGFFWVFAGLFIVANFTSMIFDEYDRVASIGINNINDFVEYVEHQPPRICTISPTLDNLNKVLELEHLENDVDIAVDSDKVACWNGVVSGKYDAIAYDQPVLTIILNDHLRDNSVPFDVGILEEAIIANDCHLVFPYTPTVVSDYVSSKLAMLLTHPWTMDTLVSSAFYVPNLHTDDSVQLEPVTFAITVVLVLGYASFMIYQARVSQAEHYAAEVQELAAVKAEKKREEQRKKTLKAIELEETKNNATITAPHLQMMLEKMDTLTQAVSHLQTSMSVMEKNMVDIQTQRHVHSGTEDYTAAH